MSIILFPYWSSLDLGTVWWFEILWPTLCCQTGVWFIFCKCFLQSVGLTVLKTGLWLIEWNQKKFLSHLIYDFTNRANYVSTLDQIGIIKQWRMIFIVWSLLCFLRLPLSDVKMSLTWKHWSAWNSRFLGLPAFCPKVCWRWTAESKQ